MIPYSYDPAFILQILLPTLQCAYFALLWQLDSVAKDSSSKVRPVVVTAGGLLSGSPCRLLVNLELQKKLIFPKHQ